MSSIKQPVIISAVRTPVGKFLGALKGFKATQLGAIVVRGIGEKLCQGDIHRGSDFRQRVQRRDRMPVFDSREVAA